MRMILARCPGVTAVVCFSDLLALGAVTFCREAGKIVGRDISIIGHDDLEEASYFEPSLSSVKVAKAEIGRMAAQALLARIDDPERPPLEVVIPPTLEMRGSTGHLHGA